MNTPAPYSSAQLAMAKHFKDWPGHAPIDPCREGSEGKPISLCVKPTPDPQVTEFIDRFRDLLLSTYPEDLAKDLGFKYVFMPDQRGPTIGRKRRRRRARGRARHP